MKRTLLLSISILVVSCATEYDPGYRYSQIRVLNNSDQPILKLSIQDQNSQRTLDCGDLNGFGFCQHPMPKPRYQGLPLDVSWVASDGSQQSESVIPASRGPYTVGSPVQLELNFAEDGSLSAIIKQESLAIS